MKFGTSLIIALAAAFTAGLAADPGKHYVTCAFFAGLSFCCLLNVLVHVEKGTLEF